MQRPKYDSKSDAERARIIKGFHQRQKFGSTTETMALDFRIGKSTLRRWLEEESEILRKSLREGVPKNPEMVAPVSSTLNVNLNVDDWCVVRDEISANRNFLRVRALGIAAEMDLTTFKVEPHWASCLEESSEKLSAYKPGDIFNLDETDLSHRLLPGQVGCLKGTKGHRGAQSKERSTILLCVNMTGTEALAPLAIGKLERPLCFPKLHAGQEFYSSSEVKNHRNQRNAWMDKEIFSRWRASPE